MAQASAQEITAGFEEVPKLQMIAATTPASATFVISAEDHTLGNSLRYMLMRDKDTQFCGYSVPHPSEALINVRLQTTGRPAIEVFRSGLSSLASVSAHIETAFIAACASAGVELTEEDLVGRLEAEVEVPAVEEAKDNKKGAAKKKGGR